MQAARKLLPLFRGSHAQRILEGVMACLILMATAFGTMMVGHNLQWYGNNTVSSDFSSLVTTTVITIKKKLGSV